MVPDPGAQGRLRRLAHSVSSTAVDSLRPSSGDPSPGPRDGNSLVPSTPHNTPSSPHASRADFPSVGPRRLRSACKASGSARGCGWGGSQSAAQARGPAGAGLGVPAHGVQLKPRAGASPGPRAHLSAPGTTPGRATPGGSRDPANAEQCDPGSRRPRYAATPALITLRRATPPLPASRAPLARSGDPAGTRDGAGRSEKRGTEGEGRDRGRLDRARRRGWSAA